MLSIGTNPTVNSDDSRRSVEVHIIDFENSIYGKPISVIFRKRLRNEVKFDNTDQLARQMNIDKDQAQQLLS